MASGRVSKSLLGTFRASSRPTSSVFQRPRLYHSYDYAPAPPFPPAESAILASAYAHVPAHGFTIDALKLGARDAGYLDISTNLLPRGVFDLVNYHLVTQRLALKDAVQFSDGGEQAKAMGVGAKVRTLTLARLRANEPVLHRWQEVRKSCQVICCAMLMDAGTCNHGPANLRPSVNWRVGQTGRRDMVPGGRPERR
jgi:ubiquinone biosynthesis protein COQ9